MSVIIGARIKESRKAVNMSMRKLAELAGYADASTILRIERGEVDLPQSRIIDIAKALGTTPAHLMGWDIKPEEAGATAAKVLKNPDTFHMMQQYLSLSETDQYTIRLMVNSLANKKED